MTKEIASILALCQQIELNFNEASKEASFEELKSLIYNLQFANIENSSQLAKLHTQINSEMSLQQFLNVVVPFERLARKSRTDADFLVSSNDNKDPICSTPTAVILDNIRSSFNVGSIFRTLECFGGSRAFLSGYTSNPDEPATQKSSMAASTHFKWTQHRRIDDALEAAKSEGYKIVALETAQNAEALYGANFAEKTAFLLGNERFGIDEVTLSKCDHVIKIPLLGRKNSMNVGVAFGIAISQWSHQWNSKYHP
jgi:23S rRNA (guanosine2251-2'-O)-methyltransferase